VAEVRDELDRERHERNLALVEQSHALRGEVERSLSWQVTRPLRALSDAGRRLTRRRRA